jgi:hypothetical protein
VLSIPLDSAQEFRVTVAGQGAEEGRSSGGQVVLITKSGTNRLHGSAYEYNRNTEFAANSWFNNRSGVDRTPLNRNQSGASLGGPINAPARLDNRAYVGKMDFILDRAAKHTLSIRGTLYNADQDQPDALAQFPDKAPPPRF